MIQYFLLKWGYKMIYSIKKLTLTDFRNEVDTYPIHFISKFQIDYLNKLTSIEILSSKTLETLLDDKDYKPRTLVQILVTPNFEEDPVLFIWKNITINSNTIFNEGSIEISPEIKTINDNYNENLLRISQ